MTRAEAGTRVYIGVGSNLEDPVHQVQTALEELARLPRTRMAARSSLYLTAPVGPQDQPDFVNAVAALDTGLGPEPLLDALQALERRHRRVRGEDRWGPRTLDLDLLLYGEQRIDSPRLTVPHPRMVERAFVLLPLAEIAPEAWIPGHGEVRALARACTGGGVRRIDPHG